MIKCFLFNCNDDGKKFLFNARDRNDAIDKINRYLKSHSVSMFYFRTWKDPDLNTEILDFGSHVWFFEMKGCDCDG